MWEPIELISFFEFYYTDESESAVFDWSLNKGLALLKLILPADDASLILLRVWLFYKAVSLEWK